MPDNSSEMSVSIHPELPPEHRWLAVYGAPFQIGSEGGGTVTPSRAIYARSAPRPEGPWSERVLLYEIPEVSATPRRSGATVRYAGKAPRPLLSPETFCYAAKAHPRFAEPGTLLLTYVCSLRGGGLGARPRLLHDLETYVPRVVSVGMPPALRGESEALPQAADPAP